VAISARRWRCLLGDQAKGLSPNVLGRLKAQWSEEYKLWSQDSLAEKQYVYWWADGICTSLREEDEERLCLLVIIGVTPEGKKEWVAISDGFRESTESWLDVLRDLKDRGLAVGPRLAVGDGALGFWSALEQVYPETGQQRCWFHKTGNVLSALPKSLQSKAKADLQAIWMAPTRKEDEAAFKGFIKRYGDKYPKATEKLLKDHDALLGFYAFPAEHWVHLRTTNPIESTFATVHINHICGLLWEYDIEIAQGRSAVQRRLPEILEDADNGLRVRFRAGLHGLAEDLCHLNERVTHYDAQINAIAQDDPHTHDLMNVPGTGGKVAAALLAAVGENPTLFANDRAPAAWIGFVLRQYSTGGRDRLPGIGKRGDVYLRNQLTHGARAVLRTLEHKQDRTSRWAKALKVRCHTKVAIVAMANKM